MKRELRIILTGLDAARKTAILYKLKLGEIVIIPTIGFNVETVDIDDIGDNCGQKIRSMWHHYYAGTASLMFPVDFSDSERNWQVQECNALTGDGLTTGLEWLTQQLA